jgi:hypothetical protein
MTKRHGERFYHFLGDSWNYGVGEHSDPTFQYWYDPRGEETGLYFSTLQAAARRWCDEQQLAVIRLNEKSRIYRQGEMFKTDQFTVDRVVDLPDLLDGEDLCQEMVNANPELLEHVSDDLAVKVVTKLVDYLKTYRAISEGDRCCLGRHDPRHELERYLGQSGRLDLAKLLHQKGHSLSQDFVMYAARSNHPSVVEWYYETVEPYPAHLKHVYSNLILSEKFDVLDWFDRKYGLDVELIKQELTRQNVRLTRWILGKQGRMPFEWQRRLSEWSSKLELEEIEESLDDRHCQQLADLIEASTDNTEEVARFLQESQMKELEDFLPLMATRGRTDLLQWAADQGLAIDRQVLDAASRHSKYDVLNWYDQRGYLKDSVVYYNAAVRGDLGLLEWAKKHGYPSLETETNEGFRTVSCWDETVWEPVIRLGDVNVLEWLKSNFRGPIVDLNKWVTALRFPDLETIEWLLEQRAGVEPRMFETFFETIPPNHPYFGQIIDLLMVHCHPELKIYLLVYCPQELYDRFKLQYGLEHPPFNLLISSGNYPVIDRLLEEGHRITTTDLGEFIKSDQSDETFKKYFQWADHQTLDFHQLMVDSLGSDRDELYEWLFEQTPHRDLDRLALGLSSIFYPEKLLEFLERHRIQPTSEMVNNFISTTDIESIKRLIEKGASFDHDSLARFFSSSSPYERSKDDHQELLGLIGTHRRFDERDVEMACRHYSVDALEYLKQRGVPIDADRCREIVADEFRRDNSPDCLRQRRDGVLDFLDR